MKSSRLFILVLLLAGVASLTAACGGSREPQAHALSLDIRDQAVAGDSTFTVAQGDTVTFYVSTDEAGSLHVHGYDYEVGFGPGMPALLTFVAHATGRFEIAMHPDHEHEDDGHGHDDGHDHNGHAHGGETCVAEVEGADVRLAVTPGEELGRFFVRVETDNFPLGHDGNHWHLYVNGDEAGMYTGAETEVTLSEGSHRLRVVLSDGDHCDLPHYRTVMVGLQSRGHEHDGSGHNHDDVPLGHLEVRP